ncbi:MAG: DUF362 domain-containing protein [Candidatus Aminicenantes bacterium]|nr:MAG: DUF362 domain-containing protein [Candidatus Aminicenantes bacterium]
MKRREFLQNAVYAGMLLNFNVKPFFQEKKTPDPSLVSGAPPDVLTRKAIDLLRGIAEFVSKNDVVMIKPNIAFERGPKFAACTNPDVVKTLVELCLEAGAKEVKVMDNPVHPAKTTYPTSGIAEAAEKAGGQVIYPESERLKSVAINGDYLKTCSVFTDFIEADKLINVPILKTHPFTRLTMGLKNWMGAIDGNRKIYHDNVNDVIVDLSAFFKPALTILDAFRVMVKNGPTGGSLSDVEEKQTVVAGRDFVAVDAMGAKICKFKPKNLGFLKKADKLGLGEIDLDELHIEMRARR